VSGSKVLNHPVWSNRSRMILYAAAALSLLAALIHLWVMPEHFEEWRGYGTFFLAVAIAQGFYSVALLRWPRQLVFYLGIGSNLAIIILYIVTRTVGIPFFGPHAGEVEEVGVVDLCAAMSELALAIALGVLVMLPRGLSRERVIVVMLILGLIAIFVGHLLHLMLSVSPAH
jgi:hypothetical protein